MSILKRNFSLIMVMTLLLLGSNSFAQVNPKKVGAWYMYFWDTQLKESQFGFQGDVQYRNWNVAGDLEQLLLRGGVTYVPKNTKVKFTLGYGHITTGAFGDSNATTGESRIYQEILIPQKIGSRFYAKHRFRYEQRFVEDQDFRTRYRYNLFLNVALNKKELDKGTYYLALYNELFINGQRDIGEGRSVEIFDRNRFYSGIGYGIRKNLKVQAGYMIQSTNAFDKGQWQLSLHHSF